MFWTSVLCLVWHMVCCVCLCGGVMCACVHFWEVCVCVVYVTCTCVVPWVGGSVKFKALSDPACSEALTLPPQSPWQCHPILRSQHSCHHPGGRSHPIAPSSGLHFPTLFIFFTYTCTTYHGLVQGQCPGPLCLLSVEWKKYGDRDHIGLISWGIQTKALCCRMNKQMSGRMNEFTHPLKRELHQIF